MDCWPVSSYLTIFLCACERKGGGNSISLGISKLTRRLWCWWQFVFDSNNKRRLKQKLDLLKLIIKRLNGPWTSWPPFEHWSSVSFVVHHLLAKKNQYFVVENLLGKLLHSAWNFQVKVQNPKKMEVKQNGKDLKESLSPSLMTLQKPRGFHHVCGGPKSHITPIFYRLVIADWVQWVLQLLHQTNI